MQKKLIALAVAGLVSGGAFAQSNVTVYGVVDVGVESGKYSDEGSVFRVQSGQSAGSRIGFKGEEALGNGLSAIFQLESGFQADTGDQTHGSAKNDGTNNNTYGSLFGRQAFAGLKSNTLGQVTIGRQYSVGYSVLSQADAFALGQGGGLQNTLANAAVPGYATRMDNAIVYVSPSFAGFNAAAAYSSGYDNSLAKGAEAVDASSATKKVGRAWALQGTYANGPLFVSAAYTQVNVDASTLDVTPALTASNDDKAKNWAVGATYDFGVAKAFAAFTQGKLEGQAEQKTRGYSAGVRVPFGAHTVIGQYAKLQDRTTDNSDFSTIALGYEYSLSKRTTAYASYAKGKNDSGAEYGLVGAATGVANTDSVVAGFDPHVVQVGVRHAF